MVTFNEVCEKVPIRSTLSVCNTGSNCKISLKHVDEMKEYVIHSEAFNKVNYSKQGSGKLEEM